jgi:asparagine synthase (glutamine-hydrolysing)
MTLIDGVFSLPPGHRMLMAADEDVSEARPEAYWDFAQAVGQSPDQAVRQQDFITRLRSLLEDTVARHLIADVPVGVFLSSGIDSTSLVALATLASRTTQARPIVHTLTVVFPEQEFSEAKLARRTAERLGTRHQEIELSGAQMLERLD